MRRSSLAWLVGKGCHSCCRKCMSVCLSSQEGSFGGNASGQCACDAHVHVRASNLYCDLLITEPDNASQGLWPTELTSSKLQQSRDVANVRSTPVRKHCV